MILMGRYSFTLFGVTIFSYNKTTFTVNDKPLYDFNTKTGELKISTSKKSLDDILSMVGNISNSGINLILPTPIKEKPNMEFNGVKSIKQVEGLEYDLVEYIKPSRIKFKYDKNVLENFNENNRLN